MKKRWLIAVISVLCLTGCQEKKDAEKVIGVLQYMEHASLNENREGFIEELLENGDHVEIIVKNAQGDLATANTIAKQFDEQGVDLVFAIATPAAQSAQTQIKERPIIFSAVSDPVASGIVLDVQQPEANITGTSDAVDALAQLELLAVVDDTIATIGILYNPGESNSTAQIAQVEEAAATLGWTVQKAGATQISEMAVALESIVHKIDALVVISDNMVASSIPYISEKLIEEQIPSISMYTEAVHQGILLSGGMDYRDLGKESAKMARAILEDGKSPSDFPVVYSSNIAVTANKSTLERLGIPKERLDIPSLEWIE